MPTTQELLDQGDLAGAVATQTAVVKRQPMPAAPRLFLFELLCFAGEWGRAAKQLDVVASQNPQTQLGTQLYQDCLAAQRTREQCFAGVALPHFLADPPAYVVWHLEGLSLLRQGHTEAARNQLARAEEARPARAGWCNGEAFADFTDSNEEVTPVLELITQNGYTWLPWEHLQSFEIMPPQKLRDLLWTPARITTNEAAGSVTGMFFAPALYHGSHQEADDLLKLGRQTEWRVNPDAQIVAAVGQRMFRVDDREMSLFAAGVVEFAP